MKIVNVSKLIMLSSVVLALYFFLCFFTVPNTAVNSMCLPQVEWFSSICSSVKQQPPQARSRARIGKGPIVFACTRNEFCKITGCRHCRPRVKCSPMTFYCGKLRNGVWTSHKSAKQDLPLPQLNPPHSWPAWRCVHFHKSLWNTTWSGCNNVYIKKSDWKWHG